MAASATLLSAPALAALNHVLGQADWARGKLQPFAGHKVRIAAAPLTLSFVIDGEGRLQASDTAPDLDITLPAAPLIALQGGEQAMKAARVEGPADLADALSFVLRHLRWDIEEDLSRVFGDIVAHRVVATLGAFADWQRQAARNLADNVGEYLTEESPTLVKSAEAAALADGIKCLRSDLVRIETRINRLTRMIVSTTPEDENARETS